VLVIFFVLRIDIFKFYYIIVVACYYYYCYPLQLGSWGFGVYRNRGLDAHRPSWAASVGILPGVYVRGSMHALVRFRACTADRHAAASVSAVNDRYRAVH